MIFRTVLWERKPTKKLKIHELGITVYIVEHCLFNSVNHEDGKIDTKNRPQKLASTGCLMCIKQ